MTINYLEITVLYPYSLPNQIFSKGLPLTNYTTIFHLMAYFTKASQYGFHKFHSTQLAALEFINRISQEIDAKKIPFSIFLDLSKAFDTLDYNVLLSKLNYYGIKDTALNCFKSYLTNRTQYVDCNGISSSI